VQQIKPIKGAVSVESNYIHLWRSVKPTDHCSGSKATLSRGRQKCPLQREEE